MGFQIPNQFFTIQERNNSVTFKIGGAMNAYTVYYFDNPDQSSLENFSQQNNTSPEKFFTKCIPEQLKVASKKIQINGNNALEFGPFCGSQYLLYLSNGYSIYAIISMQAPSAINLETFASKIEFLNN